MTQSGHNPRPGSSPSGRHRLLMVKPSAYDAEGNLLRGRRAFFPSRTLPYLAAMTGEDFDVRFLDDAVQTVRGDEPADLIVLTSMLTNVPRAIDLATNYRATGADVVIGGPGVFSCAARLRDSGAFSSIVHHEAEGVWERLLDDFRSGNLQPEYDGGHPADLSGQPLPRYDLVDMQRYFRPPGQRLPFLPVETARGCPHNCSFCGVTLFFGRQMRFRPVGDVVDEMRRLGGKYFILTDDNVGANPDRAAELFAAMKPLNIRWAGQFSVSVMQRPDVLKLAGESGCFNAMVGVESLVAENLDSVNKSQNTRYRLEEVVDAFHAAGIPFTASLIFGLDHDTPEVIDWTVHRMAAGGVDLVLPWVLTPGPGSRLFDDLKADGRILHENFSLYNGVDVVFHPRQMTPRQLQEAYWRSLRRLYTLGRSVGRSLRSPRKLDTLGFNLYFWHTIRKGRHPFTGAV
ncbi:MAG: B12-binding domain-containing radical SAM protein [Phycisphaerae bacterium]